MKNNTTAVSPKSVPNVRMLTVTAVLSAIAFLLAFIEFPVPLSLSDLPALVGAFACGPMVGVMIEFVKNLLQLLTTSTGGVGELANFLMGGSFALIAGLLYKHNRTRRMAWIACVAASLGMGIVAAAANYFLLLPLFESFMPLDQLIASFGEFIPFIQTKLDVVLYNALPFNFLKGLVVSAVTMLLDQRLSPVLKGTK